MSDASTIEVVYKSNADPRNGSSVIILGGGRGQIKMGGAGAVTVAELATLREAGLVLEVVGEEASGPVEHSHGDLVHSHDLDFDGPSATELADLAEEHDLDIHGTGAGGNVLKSDLSQALRDAH